MRSDQDWEGRRALATLVDRILVDVEGALVAAVESSIGNTLQEVVDAAASAKIVQHFFPFQRAVALDAESDEMPAALRVVVR